MPVCTCTRVQYSGPHVEWIFGPTTRPAYFTFLSGRRSFRPPSGHHIHLTIRTLELTSVTYRVGRSSGDKRAKNQPRNPTDASVSGRIGWSRPRAENSLASGESRGRSIGLKGRFWARFSTRWAPNWTACVCSVCVNFDGCYAAAAPASCMCSANIASHNSWRCFKKYSGPTSEAITSLEDDILKKRFHFYDMRLLGYI